MSKCYIHLFAHPIKRRHKFRPRTNLEIKVVFLDYCFLFFILMIYTNELKYLSIWHKLNINKTHYIELNDIHICIEKGACCLNKIYRRDN